MFPVKLLSSIVPSITSKKIKTHFNNFVSGQVKPLLCKAKAGLVKILIKKQSTPVTYVKLILFRKKRKRTKKKNSRKMSNEKSPFGSFRFHYDWCSSSSSHVMPVSARMMKEARPNRDSDEPRFGSFRLHHNWCSSSSSHVMPVSASMMKEARPNRDSDFCVENDDSSEHSSKYFDVVDEDGGGNSEAWDSPNEIDKQAEMFIAQNYAKFKLEKQRSYNKYKAMLARSRSC